MKSLLGKVSNQNLRCSDIGKALSEVGNSGYFTKKSTVISGIQGIFKKYYTKVQKFIVKDIYQKLITYVEWLASAVEDDDKNPFMNASRPLFNEIINVGNRHLEYRTKAKKYNGDKQMLMINFINIIFTVKLVLIDSKLIKLMINRSNG